MPDTHDTRPSRAIAVAAAAAACALAIGAAPACGKAAPVVVVSARDITETAVVSGTVDAAGRVQIGAVTPGVVAEVPAVEGQAVKKGDLLLRFDDRAEVAAVQQSRAALAQAQAHLGELREVTHALAVAERQQAEIGVVQAERAATRARRLQRAGGISEVDAEDAEAALALAQSRRDAAATRAQATAADGMQVQVAQAQVQAAQAAVRQAEAQLEQRRVVALVDAVVLARSVEPGDAVLPGRTLLVLAREGTAKIKIQPDEKTLAVLRLGQKAAVSADAFPDLRFDAMVTHISPSVDTSRGTIDVELLVTSAPPFLRTDMTVSVEIVVGKKTAALVVPQDAVRDLATSRPWVLLVQGGVGEKRPVTLGLKGGEMIEVVDGLAAGDEVVVGNPALKPGARVKAAGP